MDDHQLQCDDDDFLDEFIALGKQIWESNPSPDDQMSHTDWGAVYDPFHGPYHQPSPMLLIHDSSTINPDMGTGDFCSPELSLQPDLAKSSSQSGGDDTFLGTLAAAFPDQQEREDYLSTILPMIKAAEDPAGADDILKGDNLCYLDMMSAGYACGRGAAAPEIMAETCPSLINSGSQAVQQQQQQQQPQEYCRSKGKKLLEGKASKNLMAERRRRKRLNDRLSMLRSIVPNVSKMDRTSILADTIDYTKELLARIKHLREQSGDGPSQPSSVMSIYKGANSNLIQVGNSVPKFHVERRINDTRVEISCPGRPGLLASTIDTLESFGLDVQQCVISCFDDFSLQASCSEDRRDQVSSDDIKQALFLNAGYRGRCL